MRAEGGQQLPVAVAVAVAETGGWGMRRLVLSGVGAGVAGGGEPGPEAPLLPLLWRSLLPVL